MKNVPRKYDYITFIPARIDGQYAMSIKSFYKTLKTHSVALITSIVESIYCIVNIVGKSWVSSHCQ